MTSTLWALVPIWKRPGLTRVVLDHLARVAEDVAGSVDFRVQTVGSEGLVSESLARGCLPGGKHSHLEHANQPLGAKLNAGSEAIWRRRPLGLMVLGSDDLVTAGWVEQAAHALSYGAGCVGLSDVAFHDLATRQTLWWPHQWTQRHPGQPVGAGRAWSLGALDYCSGRLWQDSRDCGLDSDSWARLKRWTDEQRVERWAMGGGWAVCDVKGGGCNIWPMSRVKQSLGVAAANPDLDFDVLPSSWIGDTFGPTVEARLGTVGP